jgi:hypothetical protein
MSGRPTNGMRRCFGISWLKKMNATPKSRSLEPRRNPASDESKPPWPAHLGLLICRWYPAPACKRSQPGTVNEIDTVLVCEFSCRPCKV